MMRANYKETWTPPFAPLVFFLPCFYKYGIVVTEDNLSFGYGFLGPSTLTNALTSKTMLLRNVDTTSIKVGSASCKENLSQFGGWGIRYGKSDGHWTWAYNAKNGPFVEFQDKATGRWYRLASKNVCEVERILRASRM